jgi:hypothetical protein
MAPDTKTADCGECEKVELEKRLEAEEAARGAERELKKLAAEHQNALDSAADTAASELQKSHWESEFSLARLFHEKTTELAAASVERSRDSAKYVQTAAAWIATLYTGLLALVFSVTENPLPSRGIYAAVFLGLSVALAVAYLAFIASPRHLLMWDGGSSLSESQLNRTGFFVKWVNASVRERRWAIRASVISLAFGVAFIPAAFVSNSHPAEIPAAPTAPSIPASVAGGLEGPAAEVLAEEIADYRSAVAARNQAIANAPGELDEIKEDESDANQRALLLAALGLLIALLGPLVYGHFADDRASDP